MLAQLPVVRGYHDLELLPGGHSREVFSAVRSSDGQECVLRVYGAGTRRRGPEAPGVQAGILRLLNGLVPAPKLVEVRTLERDGEELLATSLVAGRPLPEVLNDAGPELQRSLGLSTGQILGRLSGIAMTGPGGLHDESLRVGLWPEGSESLVTWLDQIVPGSELEHIEHLDRLADVCRRGDQLLAVNPRACLVHGDLSIRNVLADPESGEITGLIDWEFAHAGHPVEDLGKLVRERPGSVFIQTAVETMNAWLPEVEQAPMPDLRERARAADLYWLIEVASRRGKSPATFRAFALLEQIAAAGVLVPDVDQA